MSTRRSADPLADPVTPYEAVAHFRHYGQHKRPGDIVALTAEEAAELTALGFVRRSDPAYRRRDIKAKG